VGPGREGAAPPVRLGVEAAIVDAHQHFWNLGRTPQPWMTDAHRVIARTFEPEDLEPLLAAAGIDTTILIQGACTDDDSDYLFDVAETTPWVGAVVAWLDLTNRERAERRVDQLARRRKLRGIRHLIHNEVDPHWILRPDVSDGILLLEEQGLILELPAEFPRHLEDVPELARRFPRLVIVIDHLAKPPTGGPRMPLWADQLRTAASAPNVYAKVSGLNTTMSKRDWDRADLEEPVRIAFEAFGPERLLWGSDWPVALLNGSYARVCAETVAAVEVVAPYHAETILDANARRLYRIGGESE
jgi:L-fucono-1,5-lactonase